jgi:hypothetical protein
MSPWETCHRPCSNPGRFNRKSLLLICSLDREVYASAPSSLCHGLWPRFPLLRRITCTYRQAVHICEASDRTFGCDGGCDVRHTAHHTCSAKLNIEFVQVIERPRSVVSSFSLFCSTEWVTFCSSGLCVTGLLTRSEKEGAVQWIS